MKFDTYQETIADFAVYPRSSELETISYLVLGLNGEAGEVAEQVKKAIRNDGHLSAERREKIKQELGDVLWYLARLATEFDVSLADIAALNIKKLRQRQKSNLLKHE